MSEKEPRFIGLEMNTMRYQIMRGLGKELARNGFDEVTIMHGWLLGYFYKHSDEEVFQKSIEQKFGMPKSSVTNILQMMEKKGYITRCSATHDSRLKAIHLTDKGKEVHLKTVAIIDEFHEYVEQDITEEEKEIFYRIEGKMTKNLESFEKLKEEQ